MFSACFSWDGIAVDEWVMLGSERIGRRAYFFDKGENVTHCALERLFFNGMFPGRQMADD